MYALRSRSRAFTPPSHHAASQGQPVREVWLNLERNTEEFMKKLPAAAWKSGQL